MIPYKQIRSAIVRGLKSELGISVIPMNDGGDIPKTSFLTYDFSDGFSSIKGHPAVWQDNQISRQSETVNFTVSFLSYADNWETSFDNAMRARDWFKGTGRLTLKEGLDVVVLNIGAVQNRDINIGTEWERRQGFDIDFRTVEVTESKMDSIDQANIKGVESIGTT